MKKITGKALVNLVVLVFALTPLFLPATITAKDNENHLLKPTAT